MTHSNEVWDQEKALLAVDGDAELLAEMAELFLQDSESLMQQIGQAVREHDAPALHRSAHTLKGSVANFHADEARETALALEMMGHSAQFAGAPQVYEALVDQMRRVESALGEFAKTVPHANTAR